jgi:hypothetical protein
MFDLRRLESKGNGKISEESTGSIKDGMEQIAAAGSGGCSAADYRSSIHPHFLSSDKAFRGIIPS